MQADIGGRSVVDKSGMVSGIPSDIVGGSVPDAPVPPGLQPLVRCGQYFGRDTMGGQQFPDDLISGFPWSIHGWS